MEAKRNQPSVIYIPSLVGWCAAVSETSRSTAKAMLDTLAPTDPILLLAVVDGPFSALPRDVRAWFGVTRENRIEFAAPSEASRGAFFEGLLKDIQRPPNHFPDGVKRKKRVLEILPVAPPPEPRQPTAAELAAQEENDQRTIALLKFRLGPILSELKRKFKRFTKKATVSHNCASFVRIFADLTNRRSMNLMPIILISSVTLQDQSSRMSPTSRMAFLLNSLQRLMALMSPSRWPPAANRPRFNFPLFLGSSTWTSKKCMPNCIVANT
jgi:hypothetical protein